MEMNSNIDSFDEKSIEFTAIEDSLNHSVERVSDCETEKSDKNLCPLYSLCIANLDESVTELDVFQLVLQLTEDVDHLKDIQQVYDSTESRAYIHIDFDGLESAWKAFRLLDGFVWMDTALDVYWSGLLRPPEDRTRVSFYVFVDDLRTDIETPQLLQAFSSFGRVFDCIVVRDKETLSSRGYGFVAFDDKESAQKAVDTRLLCEEFIKILFKEFEVFVEKILIYYRKALIGFRTRQSAAAAIIQTNERLVLGQTVWCWWAPDEPQPKQTYIHFDDCLDDKSVESEISEE
ncbi:unnamed protein product [Oppiella nova]|uniref:Serine/arginine-rich splicing factor 2 n=1 Tax=Oppiella nova TaxID=334625 RepID=A0A7R9M778_9ACAR|nr:unnamed protein product [Oppiella nova]CAG2170750.1 unnamed protein product [Oppiella nova]